MRASTGYAIALSGLWLLATSFAATAAERRDSLGRQLGSITNAIVEQNQEAEKTLNLLARVEVRPNEIVEFYEPAPGLIIISGAGAPDTPIRPQAMARSATQEWRRVAADAEMPAALRDAIERSERRQGTQRPATANQDPPRRRSKWGGGSSAAQNFTRAAGFCDAGYYSDGWDSCPDFYGFRVCLTNWRDGAYAYHHDAFNTWTQVCPATGNVVFRVSSNEFGGGVWTVNQHNVRYLQYADTWCANPFNDCPYMRTDIQNAWGVRFHFQFMVEEE